ncbi:hypothetical protein [Paracoccus zhejiangensis]|nr:hypothetical protein [Paracoccus zhejiangensis]
MGRAHKDGPGMGMTRRQFSATAMAAGLAASTGLARAQQPLPILRIVESGHSLTDGVIEPLRDMINAAGGRGTELVKSTIPGSPMQWRWDHPADPDIMKPEVMAGFDLMVNTERVPLSNTAQWHDSSGYALKFFDHAWKHGRDGKGAASILYATWIEVTSGSGNENPHNDPDAEIPFRERLDREAAGWQQILDHVNQNRPQGSPEMKLIPGTGIMAAAYDEIAAGTAPGLTEMKQLFHDNIHINLLGCYMIALAHFAVIYNRDPHGLPHGVPNNGGPSAEQAAWMQDLVWRVVTSDPRAKTDGSGKLDY